LVTSSPCDSLAFGIVRVPLCRLLLLLLAVPRGGATPAESAAADLSSPHLPATRHIHSAIEHCPSHRRRRRLIY
jgi:hypothetical protein